MAQSGTISAPSGAANLSAVIEAAEAMVSAVDSYQNLRCTKANVFRKAKALHLALSNLSRGAA